MVHSLQVGLTGGIASGKSTVAQRMVDLGAVLIDADQLAREVVQPGCAALDDIAEAFGPETINPDGTLNRARVGQLVFVEGDDAARRKLGEIVHPRVRAKADERRAEIPNGHIIVEDIPLLLETGQAERFDVVVVVEAEQEERIRRIRQYRDTTTADAKARLEFQASNEERAAIADYLIDNNDTVEELIDRVDEVYQQLRARQTQL